jgi:hypothetical protein
LAVQAKLVELEAAEAAAHKARAAVVGSSLGLARAEAKGSVSRTEATCGAKENADTAAAQTVARVVEKAAFEAAAAALDAEKAAESIGKEALAAEKQYMRAAVMTRMPTIDKLQAEARYLDAMKRTADAVRVTLGLVGEHIENASEPDAEKAAQFEMALRASKSKEVEARAESEAAAVELSKATNELAKALAGAARLEVDFDVRLADAHKVVHVYKTELIT